jgi:hypothetical protein
MERRNSKKGICGGNLEQRYHLANLNDDRNTTLKLIATEVGTYTIMAHNRHRYARAIVLICEKVK